MFLLLILKIAIDSTLITAFVTAIVTIGLFIGKESIENARNRKKEDQQKVDAFRAYTDPLLQSGLKLYERLQAIFEQKAKFLFEKAPKNHFNQYRYISTLYRLCRVLGWVRAVQRELAGMELHDSVQFAEINTSIEEFQKSFYDSKFMEGARMSYLSVKWNIPLANAEDQVQMEEEIAYKIWDILSNEKQIYARDLSEEKQVELIIAIAHIMSTHCKAEILSEEKIRETRNSVIQAITRKEAWIYLDWQNAIGEIMLEPSKGINPLRKYHVKGFGTFEDMYLEYQRAQQDEHSIPNRWIGRINKLFEHLNMKAEKKHDARIQQFRNIGSSLLNMLKQLEKLTGEGSYKPSKKLTNFLEYDSEHSNPEYYIEAIEELDYETTQSESKISSE